MIILLLFNHLRVGVCLVATSNSFVASFSYDSPTSAIGNDDEDDYGSVGITFVVTLVISVLITLVIVYIVYKMKKKPAIDWTKVAFSGTLVSDGESTIKIPNSSCDDETYEIPDNLEQATDASRYQTDPITIMQPNPAYGISLHTDEIYESVK